MTPTGNKNRNILLTAIAYTLALFTAFTVLLTNAHDVGAQAPTLIYGAVSGTGALRQMTVDSSGRQLVVLTAANDPCMDPQTAKSSAVLAVTADAIVIPLTSSQTIYVCGFIFTATGTTPSIRFQTGTGSACATGVAQLSGVMLPTAGSALSYAGNEGTIFKGALSSDICFNVGGTTPSINGVITFVKV